MWNCMHASGRHTVTSYEERLMSDDQWCSGGGTRGNAVPPTKCLGERRSPSYYQDKGERWCSSVPPNRPAKEMTKIQQSWHTSAVAMHLLSNPLSIHVRHILLTSNINILVYCFFSIDISEQHVWELWIQLFSYTWRFFFTESQRITS